MAAKGATAKKAVFEKMLEVFEGSFMYNGGKELRIDCEEESGPVQIKVTLTAAKEPVSIGGTNADMGGAAAASQMAPTNNFPKPKELVQPSDAEKKNVEDLLTALGLN